MSISQFKSTIAKHGGLARQNKFALFFSPPQQSILNLDVQGTLTAAINGSFNVQNLVNDPRDMAILCESAAFPSRQIQTLESATVRQPIKGVTSIINEDITLTFHLTNDYYIKKIFDNWNELIFNTETSRVGFESDYAVDMSLQQLNENGLPVYGVKLRKAYPLTFNTIELNNASENTTQRFGVTITYEQFVPEGSITTSTGTLGSIFNLLT